MYRLGFGRPPVTGVRGVVRKGKRFVIGRKGEGSWVFERFPRREQIPVVMLVSRTIVACSIMIIEEAKLEGLQTRSYRWVLIV